MRAFWFLMVGAWFLAACSPQPLQRDPPPAQQQ